MAKLTLNDLSSGSFTVDLLNANFTAIETAMENTLSRNGLAPNSMSAALDMNGNRILNLPTAGSNNEPVTYGQLLALGTLNLYTPENHVHTWASITGKPSTFTPSAHTHVKSDVTDLVSDLTSLDTRLDTLEAEPKIWVQSGTPTAVAGREDLWFW